MIALLCRRDFALLWFGGLISMIGNWMLSVALPMFVYQLSGSTMATGIALMSRILPRLLLGSLAGTFVDRWDRKRTMILSNLVMAVGLFPLLWVRSPEWLWLVYAVSFFQSTVSEFFTPAENALLPRVVGKEGLMAANSLNALNNNLARVIGPSLGGLVASFFSLAGVVLIDAATFVFAAGLVALVAVSGQARQEPRESGDTTTPSKTALWQEWREGLRFIGQKPLVALLFAVVILTSFGEGVFSVMFVVWVDELFGGGTLELGWLMAAQGAGGILGGLLMGGVGSRLSPFKLLGLGAGAIGVLDLILFNYPLLFPHLWPGLLLLFLVGPGAVGFGASWNTLLQRSVPEAYLGRVFGTCSAISGLLLLAGTLLAGVMGSQLGPIPMLNIQGSGYLLAGLFAWLALGRIERREVSVAHQEQAVEPVG